MGKGGGPKRKRARCSRLSTNKARKRERKSGGGERECMYVCVGACMRVYVFVCVLVRARLHVCARACVRLYVC